MSGSGTPPPVPAPVPAARSERGVGTGGSTGSRGSPLPRCARRGGGVSSSFPAAPPAPGVPPGFPPVPGSLPEPRSPPVAAAGFQSGTGVPAGTGGRSGSPHPRPGPRRDRVPTRYRGPRRVRTGTGGRTPQRYRGPPTAPKSPPGSLAPHRYRHRGSSRCPRSAEATPEPPAPSPPRSTGGTALRSRLRGGPGGLGPRDPTGIGGFGILRDRSAGNVAHPQSPPVPALTGGPSEPPALTGGPPEPPTPPGGPTEPRCRRKGVPAGFSRRDFGFPTRIRFFPGAAPRSGLGSLRRPGEVGEGPRIDFETPPQIFQPGFASFLRAVAPVPSVIIIIF